MSTRPARSAIAALTSLHALSLSSAAPAEAFVDGDGSVGGIDPCEVQGGRD